MLGTLSLEGLLNLHELDLQLFDVRRRLGEGPAEIARREKAMDKATKLAAAAEEAVKLLPQARLLSLEHGTAFNKNRFRWLEGLVSRGLGDLEEAEEALLEARDAFSDLGDGFSTALVSLDIADLYSRQDRYQDLITLCSSMAPLSGMLQHHREAFVAMQLFQSAAEEHSVTSVVVERARKALLRSQKQAVAG